MSARLQLAAIALSVAALLVATAIAWTACETPLAPSYALTEPRILAIRATPPDLLPDAGVTLDTLLYLPPGSPAPSYQWSWCATVGGTLDCTTDAAALQELIDDAAMADAGVVDYALGSNPTAVFDYPLNPIAIASACLRRLAIGDAATDDASAVPNEAAASADAEAPRLAVGGLSCTDDSWTVNVLLTVTVGSRTLQATRQLTVYLSAPPQINTNPTVAGLLPFTAAPADAGLFGNPDETADGGFDDAGAGSVSSGGIVLAALVPRSATDVYALALGRDAGSSVVCPMDGSATGDAGDAGAGPADATPAIADAGCTAPGAEVYESLTLAWYVSSGTLDHATTSLPSVALGNPQDWSALLVNQWVPPTANASSQFILVARDNRGGVGWLSLIGQAP